MSYIRKLTTIQLLRFIAILGIILKIVSPIGADSGDDANPL
ncbi:MAG: hypothetical protein ACXAC2_04010 [Candidatus Kariarchaeaceae archaeon]|jgi:hypothetical protein